MAEIITKATRVSFGEALSEMAETRSDIIVLDADLAAATNTAKAAPGDAFGSATESSFGRTLAITSSKTAAFGRFTTRRSPTKAPASTSSGTSFTATT